MIKFFNISSIFVWIEKLINFIRDIYKNNSILDTITKNQRQYSDKNVYNNIDQVLKNIIDEKN